MKGRNNKRFNKKIITTEHLALKKLRLDLNMNLTEAGKKLGLSSKSIGVIENGRVDLTQEKIERVVKAYGLSLLDFVRSKKMIAKEGLNLKNRRVFIRSVLTNKDRRSYQKIITKECRVLRSMRRVRKLSQAEASKLCDYPRATIGHIENGRIELDIARIEHIVKCYGSSLKEFQSLLGEKSLRDEVVESCCEILFQLPDEKLRLAQSLITNLA